MRIREAIKMVLGKTIESVVIRSGNERGPHDQIILVFTDGTAYEFYGSLGMAGGLDSGGKAAAINYVSKFSGEITSYSLE